MGLCEMCGRDSPLTGVRVDGAELRVCGGCSSYGVKMAVRTNLPQRFIQSRSFLRKEPEFRVIDRFSSALQAARNKRGMNQEDFARSLNEKSSIVAKWESGSLTPSIAAARRLERNLGIKLVEKDERKSVELPKHKTRSAELTLGDFVKVRKRK